LMAPHILEHRIMLRRESRIKKSSAGDIIRRALDIVRMPSI
jgi:hypothetical protein